MKKTVSAGEKGLFSMRLERLFEDFVAVARAKRSQGLDREPGSEKVDRAIDEKSVGAIQMVAGDAPCAAGAFAGPAIRDREIGALREDRVGGIVEAVSRVDGESGLIVVRPA